MIPSRLFSVLLAIGFLRGRRGFVHLPAPRGSSVLHAMPKLYDGWFNGQIAKGVTNSVAKALSDGKKNLEVTFPPVPNVEEVRFGTPLNQKFGTDIVAKSIKVKTGYKPGSDLSRNLISYSNLHWAKAVSDGITGGALGSLMGKGGNVAALTSESIIFSDISSLGSISRTGRISQDNSKGKAGEAIVAINPGGEETWARLQSKFGSPNKPFVILNGAYSTSYDIGNKKGYEEAYYLKRISKGWIYRAYPGKWEAYIEKPDGNTELVESYKNKPLLRDVSNMVRELSFKRYAIGNDRWSKGFGERL